MVTIFASTFFSNTAVNYVAFKYSEVMVTQINETMLGNYLGHRSLNIALKYWNSSWHVFWPVLTCALTNNC